MNLCRVMIIFSIKTCVHFSLRFCFDDGRVRGLHKVLFFSFPKDSQWGYGQDPVVVTPCVRMMFNAPWATLSHESLNMHVPQIYLKLDHSEYIAKPKTDQQSLPKLNPVVASNIYHRLPPMPMRIFKIVLLLQSWEESKKPYHLLILKENIHTVSPLSFGQYNRN